MERYGTTKESGAKQRNDVTLTPAITVALVQMILSGTTLYPEKGLPLRLTVKDGDTEKPIEIREGTLHAWVSRDVVIPGDGRALRDVLNDARAVKKRNDREQRQLEIIENSEIALAELVKIPITSGKMVTTKFKANKKGFKAYGKVETEFEGVNPKLAEAKIKALSFGLERLDPGRYGATLSTTNLHGFIDLSDFRRKKEAMQEAAQLDS